MQPVTDVDVQYGQKPFACARSADSLAEIELSVDSFNYD